MSAEQNLCKMYNMERPGWRSLFSLLALICTLLPVFGSHLESTCKADGDETIHDFTFENLVDGSEIDLSGLSGKAVLVINLATF